MRFYLCRHGQTHWNAKRILQGQSQSQLTDIGIAQAQSLATLAQQWSIDLVVSSHLQRAFHTAQICAEQLQTQHIAFAELAERHYGSWQGQAIATLSDFVEFRTRCYQQPLRRPNDSAENTQEIRERFNTGLAKLASQNSELENLLVVSHGDAIDCFLSQYAPPQYLKNGQYVAVDYSNGVFHLPELFAKTLPTTAV